VLRAGWRLGDVAERPEALAAMTPAGQLAIEDSRPLPHTLLAVARAAGPAARARGGGGTTLPGKLLLRSRPDAMRHLARRLSNGVVLVSGTNGKTTTAAMIAAILRAAGHEVVHNRAGANMHWGVATALVDQRGDIGVLEVDEAFLPLVAEQVEPRVIVLGNLFRDRLDAYGELEAIAAAWGAFVSSCPRTTALALNADDPTVAGLADANHPTIHFGIEDRSLARPAADHAADAVTCRRCGARHRFDAHLLAHLGHYSCSGCGAKRPGPQVSARRVELASLDGSQIAIEGPGGSIDVALPLLGLHNVYNALAAAAAGALLGVDRAHVAEGLRSVRPAFGRGERIDAGDKRLLIMLMKNPAGANELMRTLRRDERQLDLWIALNDGLADGRDVSWIWDADFELLAGCVRRVTCSGTRAAELGLRLKYAGWDESSIVVEPGIAQSIDAALAAAPRQVVALPTYSALLELRTLLAARGLAAPYWL
jgi:UDP-N-acetylmuramyl tripeptide synthase